MGASEVCLWKEADIGRMVDCEAELQGELRLYQIAGEVLYSGGVGFKSDPCPSGQ